MTADRVCAVVGDVGCQAPAGAAEDANPALRARCHLCGEAVCTNPGCSRRVPYPGRRRRLCVRCLDKAGTTREPSRSWNANVDIP